MTKVTPSMLAEFERRRLAKEPPSRIAADHGVTASTVSYRTPHITAHAPKGYARSFDYAEAVTLTSQLPTRLAAERLGVKRHTLLRALRVMRRGYP